MKKSIGLLCLLVSLGAIAARAASPVKLGIKGGLLLNSASLKYDNQAGNIKYDRTSSKPGFEAGVVVRAQFPGGFLIQPEVLYTHTKGVFPTDPNQVGTSQVTIKSNSIDVPVMVGWRFLKLVRVMAGPSFCFPTGEIFATDNGTGGVAPRLKDFVLGFQAGVGVDLGRFTLDARYCANLTEITDGKVSSLTIKGLEAKQKRFSFSLGYMLIK